MNATMTIYLKDGKTVPNIPTGEHIKRQYEKILGPNAIREFRMDPVTVAAPKTTSTSMNKQEVKTIETPITDISLIKHFTAKGKTPRAIATFLGLKVSDVETIINQ